MVTNGSQDFFFLCCSFCSRFAVVFFTKNTTQMFQMTGKVDEHALAVYGFLPEIKRIEPAGISYECRIVLDKIALNRCTLPVCKVVLESASPDEQEVSFLAFFCILKISGSG